MRIPKVKLIRALAASLVLGAGLAACDDVTASSAAMDVQFSITREVRGSEATSILPFTPQVTVKPGEIDIFGNIRTPTPCWTLASTANESGQTITFVVTARPSNAEVCTQVITVRDYSAEIRNVKSGTYTVRVLQQLETVQREPELLLETKVTVP
jgi:hypothetical protein